MYALNTEEFGHLVNPESFNSNSVRPDLYEVENNLEVCNNLNKKQVYFYLFIYFYVIKRIGLKNIYTQNILHM